MGILRELPLVRSSSLQTQVLTGPFYSCRIQWRLNLEHLHFVKI
ncbi:hypothetical protein NC651_038305 [Populus alba x Populus x berolinensis]|nr:hypothetical protein NC651_038305 [Populus alba x Populus x berolinensis]